MAEKTLDQDERKHLFIAHSHEDHQDLKKLEKVLGSLVRENLVTVFASPHLPPGSVWSQAVYDRLVSADIVILLLTPSFLESHYCLQETLIALTQHEKGNQGLAKATQVVPVVVKACGWRRLGLDRFQGCVLPGRGEVVDSWGEVAEGVRKILPKQGMVKRWHLSSFYQLIEPMASALEEARAIDLMVHSGTGWFTLPTFKKHLDRLIQVSGTRVLLMDPRSDAFRHHSTYFWTAQAWSKTKEIEHRALRAQKLLAGMPAGRARVTDVLLLWSMIAAYPREDRSSPPRVFVTMQTARLDDDPPTMELAPEDSDVPGYLEVFEHLWGDARAHGA